MNATDRRRGEAAALADAGEKEKSFAGYLALATEGDLESLAYVGYLYRHGIGVAKDEEQAIEWLAKATHRKHERAAMELVEIYAHQGDSEAIIEALEPLVKEKNLWAMFTTGHELFFALDDKAGIPLIEAAAAGGHIDALLELCHIYDPGHGYGLGKEDELPAHRARALVAMKKAADQGQVHYLDLVSEELIDGGQYVAKPDFGAARTYAEKGVAAGSDACRIVLARLLQNGWGTIADASGAAKQYDAVGPDERMKATYFRNTPGATGDDYIQWLAGRAKRRGRD